MLYFWACHSITAVIPCPLQQQFWLLVRGAFLDSGFLSLSNVFSSLLSGYCTREGRGGIFVLCSQAAAFLRDNPTAVCATFSLVRVSSKC